MTMMSAISMMPRLMPCNSSPAPEICNSMNMSTIECTAVSDCPTPTVSMNTTSKPAASHRMIVSRVLRATPPSDPAEGEGRMKTSGLPEMLSMRVLSPRIEPPLRSDEGSMASTASLCLRVMGGVVAFDERDGLRQGGDVAREDAFDVFVGRKPPLLAAREVRAYDRLVFNAFRDVERRVVMGICVLFFVMVYLREGHGAIYLIFR